MKDRRAQALLVLAFGAGVFRLGRTWTTTSYVKPGLLRWLVISGVVLLAVGVVSLVRQRRHDNPEHDQHGPRAGWLLLVPLVALLVVGPGPLGAFAALRLAGNPPVSLVDQFPPLPEVDHHSSAPLSLSEFSARALYDASRSLAHQTVRISGFVVPNGSDHGTYLLTRLAINCCAADARPVQVLVRGDDIPREPNTWLEVTGTWIEQATVPAGQTSADPAAMQASEVTDMPEPAEPYEQALAQTAR